MLQPIQDMNNIITEKQVLQPGVHDDFNAFSVPLKGSNLIEASAGTGKTYSIAVLALRLIMEEGIPVDKILMVTFTRDATAEMKLRVRQFIREALQACREFKKTHQEQNFDGLDKSIVEKVRVFGDFEVAEKRLQDALLQFDKASIFTIHGFCARILGEHAFESGRLFHTKTLDPADYNEYIEDAFNQAWREEVTVMEENLLLKSYQSGFSRARVFSLVREAINGKKIYIGDNTSNQNTDQFFQNLKQDLLALEQPVDNLPDKKDEAVQMEKLILEHISAKREEWKIVAAQHRNTHVKNKIPEILSTTEKEIFDKFKKFEKSKYIDEFLSEEFKNKVYNLREKEAAIETVENKIKNFKEDTDKLVGSLVSVLAKRIHERVQKQLIQIKENQGQATYDDLITSFHRVICGDQPADNAISERLAKVLQHRYRAVFIDEFQDTDKFQFEIFHKLFGANRQNNQHILFYIGDPKQSIYAFRTADLETYFRAAELVENIWQMNKNYRSTADYIQAMNDFFLPEKDFDVFKSEKMKYHIVEAPEKAIKGHLMHNGNPLEPMRIVCCGKAADVHNKTILTVRQLLNNSSFQINIDGTSRSVTAGQIGILVRNKIQGRLLRERLSSFGIPAVTVSDTKVFETSEAQELHYILRAIHEINIGSINRALLTNIAGVSIGEINRLHVDRVIQTFRNYQEEWQSKGVYNMLRQFLSDSKIIKRRQEGKLENADRILANTMQLMEMLHEAEADNKYAPEELIAWLKKGIDGDKYTEDEYLQRIENDEAAVKIVTMHSCKGLEYDIVIAPYLDMKASNKFSSTQIRLNDGYYTADKKIMKGEIEVISQNQIEQENLRLLYVAITRAKYHCYILSVNCKTGNRNTGSSLKGIQQKIIDSKKQFSEIRLIGDEETKVDITKSQVFELDPPEFSSVTDTVIKTTEQILTYAKIPNIELYDANWQKTSYSKLNVKQELFSQVYQDSGDNEFDKFVFRQMRKGAQTGNMLHDLFERLDFTNKDYWENNIKSSLNRYPGTGVKDEDAFLMTTMLEQITNTKLPTTSTVDFTLNNIPRSKRLNELEFDLPLSNIDWNSIPTNIDGGKIPIRIKRDVQISGGILNGKVDLFFEHEGCYYILDWKSNHLGNRPEDYHVDAMAASMEENNYFLQYYLYCLALYRYLQSRLPGFDYEKQFGGVYYLFVRGMRMGQHHGIYFHKPRLEDLLLLEHAMIKQRA